MDFMRIFVRHLTRRRYMPPVTFQSMKGKQHVKPPVEFPRKARGNLVKTPSIKMSALRLGFNTPKEMYPEYPLEKPPKLWMITQIKGLKYRPYWEKEAMKEMGLYKIHDISIQVNRPNVNELLWQVKHLIKIQPVRFPEGEPTKDDIGFTQLCPDGRFVIYKRLTPTAIENEDVVPTPGEEDYKVVDGYRKCNGCRHRRCTKLGMCQKLWMQRGFNNYESIAPRLFNFVENPLKKQKMLESQTFTCPTEDSDPERKHSVDHT